MIFGYALLALGYTLFYWGWSHFQSQRYSMYQLLGFGTLFKGVNFPPGTPVQFKS